MAERFAITAGTIVPMNAPPVENGAVIVSDDKIERVIPRSELPSDIRVEDHPDGILLPAFVNAHTHLAYTLFRGLADDEGFFDWLTGHIIPLGIDQREQECRDGARLGIQQCFRNGITTLAECHYTPWGREAMAEAGMKGVAFLEIFGIRTLNLTHEIEKHRREIEELAEGATDRLRIGVSPHAPYSVPPPTAEMASQVARELGLPISIHVAETHEEVELFRHGTGPYAPVRALVKLPAPDVNRTPLSYLDEHKLLTPRTLLIHGIHLSDADLGTIAARGCTLVTCPTSNAKLGCGIARADTWKIHGIPICIATDSLTSGESFDLFEEMRRLVLMQRGLTGETDVFSAEEVLRMVTTNSAKALGMENMVGDLRAGSCADIMVIEPDMTGVSRNRDVYQTLLWGTRAEDIVAVWADGREVFRR